MAISGSAVQTAFTTKGIPAGSTDTLGIGFGSTPISGNYLMTFFACRGNSLTFTPPAGYEVVQQDTNGDIAGFVAWKKADGTEVGVDVTVDGTITNTNLTVMEFPGTSVELNSVAASNKDSGNRQTSVTTVNHGNVTIPDEGGIAITAAMVFRYEGWDTGGYSWSDSFTYRADTSSTNPARAGIYVANRVYESGGGVVNPSLTTNDVGSEAIGFIVVFAEETIAGIRITRTLPSVDLS